MSNIYIQEPATSGKVVLTTTVGDIDIELWSKECPLACKNFIQLCEEGYYEGTIFHRLVKNFIVQGGDPTGTGHGGNSIYGNTFKDEFHSRLRFVRRGLLAMANAGPMDNASQFFFTLIECPELNNKHTIFGKVVGDTLFNMIKLGDTPIDSNDRPKYPHKILKTRVLNSPFDDIIPRAIKNKDKSKTQKRESKSVATKNYTLLSFGEEAEGDELDCDAEQDFKSVKSIHDCVEEQNLSKKRYSVDSKEYQQMANKKTKKVHVETKDEYREEEAPKTSELETIRSEFKTLKSEMKVKKQTIEIEKEKEKVSKIKNENLNQYYDGLMKVKEDKKIMLKGTKREQQTLLMLNKFKKKIHSHKTKMAKEGEEVEVNEENWLGHNLKFENPVSVPEYDGFIVHDPRSKANMAKDIDSIK